jgi:hypothetical protein
MGLLALLLSSCARVTIKDSVWYGSLGAAGAAEEHTLTSDSATLTLAQWAAKWDDLSNPMVCTLYSTFSEWKADIEKLCSYSNDCDYQTQQQIQELFEKLDKFKQAAKK